MLIYFDATVLNTRLLWSLARLPNLEDLKLVTERFSHDLDDELCTEILRCCSAGLKSFTVENSYTNQGRVRVLDRLQSAIQGRVISMIDRMPASGAASGRLGGGSRLSLQDFGMTKSTPHLVSKDLPSVADFAINTINSDDCGGKSNLKRLCLKHFGIQASRLIEIFKYCPQLEELDTQNIFYEQRGSEQQHWATITQHCQQLRTLRMSGRSDCFDFDHIAKLIICHPQLEAFYMHLNTTNLEEWRSLDSNLADYAKDHDGQQHPLKTLSVKGYHKETLSLLLEVLSVQSMALETLIVGSPWFFQIFLEHSPGSAFSSYESLAPLQTPAEELFERPWHTLKESLTRLDISTTIVADREVASSLFHRLQELENLRALHVSARHIIDWVPESIASTSPTTIHDKVFILPEVVDYTFPSLLDFLVREEKYSPTTLVYQISVAEAVWVIATVPALQYFHLGRGSIEEEDFGRLRWAFPDFFMAIPKSRLDWIGDDSS